MLSSVNQLRVLSSYPEPVRIGRYYYIYDNVSNCISRFDVPDIFISPGLSDYSSPLWVFSCFVSSDLLIKAKK